ncbi:sigma-70 family RNA polymerase sigma factor [Herbidospora cretacea]|uniref:sigma-70 family RNA polymerase sigma factor n=1 Tax=Herbidospora cretacea TaxID=28444 RepID=UPI0007746A3B|nr:sigma-70 family RNA polymerase sigma factor [Herbidospora cretacea]
MSGPTPKIPVDEAFEAQRPRLHAVAHRMLGSHADAEDVVQEAWLRLSRQDTGTIHNLAAWLTTVVGRISLDLLRSRQTHREDQLPDLVVTADNGPAPEENAAIADSVGLALLVVLESLTPSERLAFVLHDLFGVPFDEIAHILGKSTDATKMLASRARRKVRTPDHPPTAGREQRQLVQAFLTAAREGDFEALLRVLHPEVKLTVDTPESKVVILGATQVAAGATSRATTGKATQGQSVRVNGLPGFLTRRENGTPLSLMAFTVTENRITEIKIVTDEKKLASINLPDPA